ncbi:hypothetical protein LCGC14_3151840, partial [marine sediment metagenome]
SSSSNKSLVPFINDIDFVQFMGIEKIGYQGQPFDKRVIDKIIDYNHKKGILVFLNKNYYM